MDPRDVSKKDSNKADEKVSQSAGGARKRMSGKAKIAIVVVVLMVLIGFRVNGIMKQTALKQAAEMNRVTYIPVEVLTATEQDISSDITLSGKVQADKEAPVMVKTPGKVTAVYAKVGDVVKKDQVLFSLDKTDVLSSYNQAAAAYQMARANYEMNMSNYQRAVDMLDRTRQLYEVGAVSKLELEQAEIAASDATRQIYEAQLAQAEAGYNSASDMLNNMDVKAPIAGILTALDANVGSVVSNAAPAGKVVELSRVYVTVSVSEKEINNIKDGQKVQVEIASAALKAEGVLEGLSVAANVQGKYTLKTYLDNPEGIIKPGMFANVTLSTAARNNVLVVPTDAVVFHSGKNVVYVVQENKAVEKQVTTGLENGTHTEIVSGLTVGEIVIIKGQNFVNDGSEVKVTALDGQDTPTQTSTQTGGGAQ